MVHKKRTDSQYLSASRLITIFWGLFSIFIALYANRMGNLLEAVNKLGSLFYGVILGIFIVAFYFKKIGGTATFIAALITECIIFYFWWEAVIAYLWLNLIGCVLVVFFASVIQAFKNKFPTMRVTYD
jgi:hypothetical protein